MRIDDRPQENSIDLCGPTTKFNRSLWTDHKIQSIFVDRPQENKFRSTTKTKHQLILSYMYHLQDDAYSQTLHTVSFHSSIQCPTIHMYLHIYPWPIHQLSLFNLLGIPSKSYAPSILEIVHTLDSALDCIRLDLMRLNMTRRNR